MYNSIVNQSAKGFLAAGILSQLPARAANCPLCPGSDQNHPIFLFLSSLFSAAAAAAQPINMKKPGCHPDLYTPLEFLILFRARGQVCAYIHIYTHTVRRLVCPPVNYIPAEGDAAALTGIAKSQSRKTSLTRARRCIYWDLSLSLLSAHVREVMTARSSGLEKYLLRD